MNNQPYESAKKMQEAFPRTDQTAEQDLHELLAYSIIDIPMVHRRKEIASRVARCFAGHIRLSLQHFQYDEGAGPVIKLSDLSTVLSLVDGEF